MKINTALTREMSCSTREINFIFPEQPSDILYLLHFNISFITCLYFELSTQPKTHQVVQD